MRVRAAAVGGSIVGLGIDALCNAALYPPFDLTWPPNLTGFWGVLYGSFGGVAAFGLLLLVTDRKPARTLGRFLAVAIFGFFGVAVLWWIAWWGVPPLTLEGAWMYPLGLGCLGVSALLLWLPRLKGRVRDRQRANAGRYPGSWP